VASFVDATAISRSAMDKERGADALLKWLAVVVPGLSAGTGWTAASGSPPLIRVAWGIAVGVAIYALLHLLLRAVGNRK
jgi:hypothetical protein